MRGSIKKVAIYSACAVLSMSFCAWADIAYERDIKAGEEKDAYRQELFKLLAENCNNKDVFSCADIFESWCLERSDLEICRYGAQHTIAIALEECMEVSLNKSDSFFRQFSSEIGIVSAEIRPGSFDRVIVISWEVAIYSIYLQEPQLWASGDYSDKIDIDGVPLAWPGRTAFSQAQSDPFWNLFFTGEYLNIKFYVGTHEKTEVINLDNIRTEFTKTMDAGRKCGVF